MLALLMIATSLSFGQIVKKDSLYCRTQAQEKEVIKTYLQKDLLDTLYNDCKDENSLLKDAIEHQAKVIVEQGQIIAKTESIVAEKDIIINAKDSDLKAEKKKNRIAKVKNIGLGAGLVASAVLNVIMVIKIVGSKL